SVRDGCRTNPAPVHLPCSAGKEVVLEEDADGSQVKLGRHVQHGIVFVVEAAMSVRVVVVAFDQIEIEIVVRAYVPLRVHRDETGMLKKSWVNVAAGSRIARWHPMDEVVFKPGIWLGRGKHIDFGR